MFVLVYGWFCMSCWGGWKYISWRVRFCKRGVHSMCLWNKSIFAHYRDEIMFYKNKTDRIMDKLEKSYWGDWKSREKNMVWIMILLASNGEINDVVEEKQFLVEFLYCLENSYLWSLLFGKKLIKLAHSRQWGKANQYYMLRELLIIFSMQFNSQEHILNAVQYCSCSPE